MDTSCQSNISLILAAFVEMFLHTDRSASSLICAYIQSHRLPDRSTVLSGTLSDCDCDNCSPDSDALYSAKWSLRQLTTFQSEESSSIYKSSNYDWLESTNSTVAIMRNHAREISIMTTASPVERVISSARIMAMYARSTTWWLVNSTNWQAGMDSEVPWGSNTSGTKSNTWVFIHNSFRPLNQDSNSKELFEKDSIQAFSWTKFPP